MKYLTPILLFSFVFESALHAAKDNVVSLRLKVDEGSFIAEFSNQTKSDITILKPLDGSMWCWHMPYYDFSVFDSNGEAVSIGSRCGLSGFWAETEWPKDYLLVIKAGEVIKLPVTLPYHLEDGRYQISLAYIYSNDGTRKVLNHEYPEELWSGRLKSNLVSFVVGAENKGEKDHLKQPTPAVETPAE